MKFKANSDYFVIVIDFLCNELDVLMHQEVIQNPYPNQLMYILYQYASKVD